MEPHKQCWEVKWVHVAVIPRVGSGSLYNINLTQGSLVGW